MAEVYLAVSQGPGGFNKLVVIKKALPGLALQPEFLTMFLDEALGARMNHPNVVQTYEFGEEEGRHFIAMDTRRPALQPDPEPDARPGRRARGPLSRTTRARAPTDTLGLDHAHGAPPFRLSPLDVVHCDVTPHKCVRHLRRLD